MVNLSKQQQYLKTKISEIGDDSVPKAVSMSLEGALMKIGQDIEEEKLKILNVN